MTLLPPAAEIFGSGSSGDVAAMQRVFRAIGERRYVFAIPDLQLELDVDRLRREKHTLVGELAVRCGLAGRAGGQRHLA